MKVRNSMYALFACAIVIIAATGVALPASASTLGITSVGALGSPVDTFDWAQLGPTTVTLSSPQNVVSAAGATASVSSAGNQLQYLIQGTNWDGNFAPGTSVLWDVQAGPDITFSLTNPVKGIGAQIQPDFNGNFTAQITAFDKSGTTLGSFSESGTSTSNDDGSAIFIGLVDSSADIAKIQFILTDASSAPNDFAIGPINISGSVSATPLPPALLSFASALAGLSFFAFWRRSRKATV